MKKIFTGLLLLLTIITLTGCKTNNSDLLFDLILGEEYSIDLNANFIDPGFIAKDSSVDISSYVTVTGEVDTSVIGTYIITYKLVYGGEEITKTRTVYVGSFNTNCSEIDGTELLACQVVWTEYLNTVVKLTIYVSADTEVNTNDLFDEIDDILAYYNIMSDKYKSYDGMMNVYELNQNTGVVNTVDPRLFDLIEFTLDHQDEVNNLFNAALGPVLQIWHDYRERCDNNDICDVPPMTILNEANQHTDSTKIILDSENHTVFMEENMGLDLGGVSKGYVSREILEYLSQFELHGFLLNNGESNISIGGIHPTRENTKFIIAITDPTFELPYYATIYLSDNEQLVTSGDYQKFYTVDGQKYHHIIHPTTLMPESYSRSVSIITTDPALADLYSTAIFNMTVAEGQAFVNGIEGMEAIWYGMDGTISFSANFEANYLIETFN